jgi:putative transcriptional regulator
LEIASGIYFSASKQNLDYLVAQTKYPYKIFIGNSGWGAGQLEGELEEGAWLSIEGTIEYLFHDSTEIWHLVSRQIGRTMLESMLNITEIPDDPRVN